MLHVSIFIELLRSHPRATFWLAALAQAVVWWLVPTVFYGAPPGDLPHVLALGREFQLGSWQGPPLAYWIAELAFSAGGLAAVYLVAQLCVVVAYGAVFTLAAGIVGLQHAAISVLLMLGIASMTLPTPDFGPAVLAMPLSALILLHFWRAIGQGQRAYWFLLALEIGLLLLTTYAGLILFGVLVVFIVATARGRAALRTFDPWMAGIVILVLLLPHLIWLDLRGGDGVIAHVVRRLHEADPTADAVSFARMLALVVVAHAGLVVLVAVAAGWWMRRRETPPEFVRRPVTAFARRFVFFTALAPVGVATVSAAVAGARAPIGGIGTHVLLSGLAVVILAGPIIAIHRQRIVAFAWTLLLLLPPAVTVVAILVLPWTVGIELQVAAPAGDMGRFFAETFERRTGRPLQIVAGEERLAALISLAAPSRPSVYDHVRPERTPWVSAEDFARDGAIVVWRAADTAGAPPADIRARFPDLVPEVPRAFAHLIQGRLPLARIGWAMIRPQAAPGAAAPPARQ